MGVKFGLPFHDFGSVDFEKFYNFGKRDSNASFAFAKPLKIFFDPENGVQAVLPSSTHYVDA